MQSLFSEHWHIVRHLRPQLRQNIEILPRILRGKSWFLLYEPMSQRFVRVSPETWHIITLLNGRYTVEQIWDKAAEQIEQYNRNLNQQQRAISQNELVQLLTQLYNNDLLQTEVSFDAEEMSKRSLYTTNFTEPLSYQDSAFLKLPKFP